MSYLKIKASKTLALSWFIKKFLQVRQDILKLFKSFKKSSVRTFLRYILIKKNIPLKPLKIKNIFFECFHDHIIK